VVAWLLSIRHIEQILCCRRFRIEHLPNTVSAHKIKEEHAKKKKTKKPKNQRKKFGLQKKKQKKKKSKNKMTIQNRAVAPSLHVQVHPRVEFSIISASRPR
jgi:hypothetical protein